MSIVIGAIIAVGGYVAVMFLGRGTAGTVAGALCGMLPFLLHRNKRPMFAKIAISGCAVAGLALGIILALPIAVIFTAVGYFIAQEKEANQPPTAPSGRGTSERSANTMTMKILNILCIICAVVGVPLAILLLLAGGMKSIPRFTAQELAISLPLPAAAALFGAASIFHSRTFTPRKETSKWVTRAVVVSVLIAGSAVITYFDTHN